MRPTVADVDLPAYKTLRCCGRKPIHYKGGQHTTSQCPHLFCDRCCREYDPISGEQRVNWAWTLMDGVWVRRKVVSRG